MPTAFTEKEMEIIRRKLKEEALSCIKKYGIKRTNVEQLAQAAGISKGAFYKFYESKEMLFFEVIEDLHSSWYEVAMNTFEANKGLPNKKMLEKVLLEVFEYMRENSVMDIMENEMDILLRKIPQEVIDKHYHDEILGVNKLVEYTGIKLKVSIEVFVSAILMLFMSVSYKNKFGSYFDETFKIMIEAICEKMVN